jgi:hypothetical protein
VILAAKLRALAIEDALDGRLEPRGGDASGDGVDLRAEGGNGPVVDHAVGRCRHEDVDHLVDRNDHLVVDGEVARSGNVLGDQRLTRLVIEHPRLERDAQLRITVLPVPLIARGLQGKVGLRVAVLEMKEAEGGDGDGHQDEDRQHRPGDFEHGVVGRFRRRRIGALVETVHDVEQEEHNEDGDGDDDDVDEVVELMDLLSDRRRSALHAHFAG